MSVSKWISGAALAALALAMAAPASAQDRGGRGHHDGDRDVDVRVRIDARPPVQVYAPPPVAYGYGDRGHRHAHVLSVREMRHSLRARGFSEIRAIDYRPRDQVYTAYATGRRGNLVFLTVDGFSGEVLSRQIVASHRRDYRAPSAYARW